MNFFAAASSQFLAFLQLILLLAAIIGGMFVVRTTKKTGLVQIQSDTIIAQQQQIDALKAQNKDQQEKIDHLEYKFNAMTDALKDEGILITIDGERVTIKNVHEPDTSRHIIRKPTKKPTVKKAEDQ